MANDDKKFCPCCGRLLNHKQFFRSNNLEKYPDGLLDTCKKCATLMVDNFNPDTFTPILKECDVPYIEREWNASLLKYSDKPEKLTSTAVIGRYLAKMQLSHWRDYRWKDTGQIEKAKNEERTKALKAMGYSDEEVREMNQRFEASNIQSDEMMSIIKERADLFQEANQEAMVKNMMNSGALGKTKKKPGRPKKTQTLASSDTPSVAHLSVDRAVAFEKEKNKMFEDSVRARLGLDEEEPDLEPQEGSAPKTAQDVLANPYFEDNLTEDDKKYLSIKWGNYTPQEWVQLEKLYQDMCHSYDIQTAGHENDLKLVCKTSLKTNQLLDLGDIAGASQSARMYDSLMKSGRFTAAQNKSESGEFVNSVAEIVAICEKEGFIPRYHVDEPQDRIDQVLLDQKNYLAKLVKEELNLGNMIENALQAMKRQQESENASKLEAEAEDEEPIIEANYEDEEEEMTDEGLKGFDIGEDDE